MNITPTSMSFGATLRGPIKLRVNKETNSLEKIEKSPEEIARTYDLEIAKIRKEADDKIAKIEKQKAISANIDTFIRNDKEIANLVEKLPAGEVLINSEYEEELWGGPAHCELEYRGQTYDTQKDGKVNKEGILGWLNGLISVMEN